MDEKSTTASAGEGQMGLLHRGHARPIKAMPLKTMAIRESG
jgi:hypothetical protein